MRRSPAVRTLARVFQRNRGLEGAAAPLEGIAGERTVDGALQPLVRDRTDDRLRGYEIVPHEHRGHAVDAKAMRELLLLEHARQIGARLERTLHERSRDAGRFREVSQHVGIADVAAVAEEG